MSGLELLRITFVKKSRKDRKCWGCGRDLPKGGRYYRLDYLFRGRFVAVCTCRESCETMVDSIDQGPELQEGLFFPLFSDYLKTLNNPPEVDK